MDIRRARLDDLDSLAELFDLYRQFYRKPPDLDLAREFLSARLSREESVVYLARDDVGRGIGFVQLYPSWSSTLAGPVWILYDLFVREENRRGGVGRALMNKAADLARKTGAVEINLSTAKDNTQAQALYESLGYVRDEQFFVYSLNPAGKT
jgi:ribosomal protein S18 acetylase RimI-like enzyme